MLLFASMDPFVRRLVERLLEPSAPLSRNRHFHTLDNAEGRAALKASKRLRALHKEILACQHRGGTVRLFEKPGRAGEVELEVELKSLKCTSRSTLSAGELELLGKLPGLSALLGRGQS